MRARIVVLVALLFSVGISGSELLHAATCDGATPCKACKNCSYCKHCAKDGGTCGVCRKKSTSSTYGHRMTRRLG